MKRYDEIALAIKSMVKKKLKNARVYVFCSVLKGEITASSDIDVLIVGNISKEEAVKLKVEILKHIGLDVPVQIHVASEEEFKNWYARFIDRMKEV